ncbi:MAG: TonB-dependent receptor, partial [Myxococcales bacterium]|nr:TonB-dependent receptor [Myxococcales bacterium]
PVQPSQIGDQRLFWAAGAFTTLSVKPRKYLTLSGGIRYDYGKNDGRKIFVKQFDGHDRQGNSVRRQMDGVVSPRAAVVYASSNERVIIKAFYSRAFFSPTNWQRFSSAKNRQPGVDLDYETANNVEGSARVVVVAPKPTAHELVLRGSLYGTFYDNVHQLKKFEGDDQEKFYAYRTRVFGSQLTLEYRFGSGVDMYASYSYTRAKTSLNELGAKLEKTRYLAPHKGFIAVTINLMELLKNKIGVRGNRHQVAINLRANIVGPRTGFRDMLDNIDDQTIKIGGEDVNVDALRSDEIARARAYATLNGAITYSVDTGYGVFWVQLSGLNLLNFQYSDPIVRDTTSYAPALPQPGISGFGRIGFEF